MLFMSFSYFTLPSYPYRAYTKFNSITFRPPSSAATQLMPLSTLHLCICICAIYTVNSQQLQLVQYTYYFELITFELCSMKWKVVVYCLALSDLPLIFCLRASLPPANNSLSYCNRSILIQRANWQNEWVQQQPRLYSETTNKQAFLLSRWGNHLGMNETMQ